MPNTAIPAIPSVNQRARNRFMIINLAIGCELATIPQHPATVPLRSADTSGLSASPTLVITPGV